MLTLLVDADPIWRATLREWLVAAAAEVIEAETAEQALERLATHGEPAVVFCEAELPFPNGIWLAEYFGRHHPQTAVVMLTAQADLERAVRSIRAGTVDYLIKPITRLRLEQAQERALLIHQARQTVAQMQRELERRRAELTETIAQLELSTWTSLQAVLATRHPHAPESAARARRIAASAVNVGMMLQVGEPDLTDIEWAALLQDPTSPVGEEERRMLALLEQVPLLTGAIRIASAVHERFDGTGSPLGLRGDLIPLGARIIAAVAAYDELVSGAGGLVITPAAALDELSVARGATFDPAVLGALRTLRPGAAAPATRSPGVTDAVSPSTGMDPRRRWMRKYLTSAVRARIGTADARVIDVGYGGFRFETRSDVAAPPFIGAFRVRLPQYNVYASARCVWTRPEDPAGAFRCGAALLDEDTGEDRPWRKFVDSLEATPTHPAN